MKLNILITKYNMAWPVYEYSDLYKIKRYLIGPILDISKSIIIVRQGALEWSIYTPDEFYDTINNKIISVTLEHNIKGSFDVKYLYEFKKYSKL